jgi:hypothetical protein
MPCFSSTASLRQNYLVKIFRQVTSPKLLRRRHHKLGTLLDAFRPALHDRLLLGIETHAFIAVRMRVAEQALLPAAETVPLAREWVLLKWLFTRGNAHPVQQPDAQQRAWLVTTHAAFSISLASCSNHFLASALHCRPVTEAFAPYLAKTFHAESCPHKNFLSELVW